MKFHLQISDDLRDFIRHLPPAMKEKIKEALSVILHEPTMGKALVEELLGLRSYRVGKMRVIYKIISHSIVLVSIGPRKTIYQKVALELKLSIESKEKNS